MEARTSLRCSEAGAALALALARLGAAFLALVALGGLGIAASGLAAAAGAFFANSLVSTRPCGCVASQQQAHASDVAACTHRGGGPRDTWLCEAHGGALQCGARRHGRARARGPEACAGGEHTGRMTLVQADASARQVRGSACGKQNAAFAWRVIASGRSLLEAH